MAILIAIMIVREVQKTHPRPATPAPNTVRMIALQRSMSCWMHTSEGYRQGSVHSTQRMTVVIEKNPPPVKWKIVRVDGNPALGYLVLRNAKTGEQLHYFGEPAMINIPADSTIQTMGQ